MKALTWHGIEDVRVQEVPDPRIESPTDAIVRVTSTAICGPTCTSTRCRAHLQPGDILSRVHGDRRGDRQWRQQPGGR